MSFLVDPPLLYASGQACARLGPRSGRVLGGATALAFLATSVSLYANRRWTRPLWQAFGARDGRDFMWNFPALGIDAGRAGAPMHALAAAMFAAYPAWLALGYAHARR